MKQLLSGSRLQGPALVEFHPLGIITSVLRILIFVAGLDQCKQSFAKEIGEGSQGLVPYLGPGPPPLQKHSLPHSAVTVGH